MPKLSALLNRLPLASRVMRTLASLTHPKPGGEVPAQSFLDWNLNPLLHPLEVSGGQGGRVFGTDGRVWVDLLSGWGANILGHGHPGIAESIARQAREGSSFGLPNPVGKRVQNLLCDTVAGTESVKFGKNGSDATLAAVRLARAVTSREIILYRGYHGFHDWYIAASSGGPGVPKCLHDRAELLPVLDPRELQKVLERHPGQIAALILDTAIPPVPAASLLLELRDILHHAGALLIFDEIGTSFRVAPGGIQELTGVRPDLACYGKAMANGAPLSALLGPKRLMQHVDRLNLGMTFEWESLSLAAAEATILEVIKNDVCRLLAAKGDMFKHVVAEAAKERGVSVKLYGASARCQLSVDDQAGISGRELRWLIIQKLAEHNVFTLGTFLTCQAHDDDDQRLVAQALIAGLDAVSDAVKQGSVDGLMLPQLLAGIRT